MEELLLEIMRESSGLKGIHLKDTCQQAYDLLCSQQGTVRETSHELRRVCFIPLQIALESKRPKLVSLALNGFHKILRDDRFHKGNEPEDDSLWLPSQLLCATSSMASHPQETQVHILRVILALGIRNGGALNGRLVLWVVSRCAEATSSPQVAAAARAAAAMTIRAFCSSLDEECQEILNDTTSMTNKMTATTCFSEIIPIMQYLCCRLCETQLNTKNNVIAIFFLECLLTLLTSLPENVNTNSHFTSFLWQKFCPALISFLGTPRVDKKIKSREEGHSVDDSGRGSGSLASAPSFNSQQAKSVYSIVAQLTRLVGCIGSLRPVLEALYHRMLLYPPISHRIEALASTKDLLKDPKKISSLLILKQSNSTLDQHSDEMALIRLIMDAIEDCAHSNNANVLLVGLECVTVFLEALEELCEGKYLPINFDEINKKWKTLDDADYKGPLTYQSLARLPSPYRDLVAEMQNTTIDNTSESSNTSGPEENSLGSEVEMDSDTDDVFLPSNIQHNKYKLNDEYLEETQVDEKSSHIIKNIPRTLNLGRCNVTDYNVDIERQNARQYIKTLQTVMVPKLLSFRTCIEVDESMQDFASKCCQYNATRSVSNATIMNADGIYLATYSALLLNLKLIISGYYNGKIAVVPLSEDEFVDEVQGSGVLVYLSATWLSEVYQQIITTSILELGGFRPLAKEHNALVNLLMDFGGIGTNKLMCDWQRLKEVSMSPSCLNDREEKSAALKLARRLLTCTWDSIVTLLSTSLVGKYSIPKKNANSHMNLQTFLPRKSKFLSKKNKTLDTCITLSLENLHKAARISNVLNLQSRCNNLLAILSNSACAESPSTKFLTAHALSLDILITGGLELGSNSVDCWKHIFAACQHINKLEHTLFGQQCNTTTPLITLQTSRNKTISFTQNSNNFLNEKFHQNFNLNQNYLEDETCIDVYSFLQSNIDCSSFNNKMSVTSVIQKCSKETNKSCPFGYICGTDAAKVCCALSQCVDALFSDAASKLNLPALKKFLQELCKASEKQLHSESTRLEQTTNRWWRGNGNISNLKLGGGGSLLNRVGEVTLQCLKSPRPLAHHMAVWTIVGPHFMKAACNKDRRISKKAIQCIHDAVTMLLNEQIELPHFHFNEALLKPFENLLCLELCDTDVQEQIISCICEFVEANQLEIKSGWRPLFGTLKAAHNSNQFSAVLEIFKVFLNTDNTLVFANAAVDCILCLLSYVKGSTFDHILPSPNNIVNEASSPNKMKGVFNLPQIFLNKISKDDFTGINTELPEVTFDVCKESLHYLENCAEILSMMYSMPKCPTFNTAHRINMDIPLQVVDALFPKSAIHIRYFSEKQDVPDDNVISYRILSTNLKKSPTTYASLSKIDKPSGILKVWHILIEGLISASMSCQHQYQAAVLETLFKILQDIMVIPGTIFGLHTINHLLLPAMQNWLRQTSNVDNTWENFTANFKQCCGMATDLVVKYLHHSQDTVNKYNILNDIDELQNDNADDKNVPDTVETKAITFALKQLLIILVECVSQPQEIIARLGASCIRHIILTSGNLLSQHQWEIACTSLHRACNASLTPLQQLTLAFEEDSNSFYGDLAIVKVAARCDSSINDNVRLHSMAQQVFFYDYSREHSINGNNLPVNGKYHNLVQLSKNLVLTDDRSYIFLLYPQDAVNTLNPDVHLIRISLKSLIIGLLAHQILVQIIATILLQQTSNIIPFNHILIDTFKASGLPLNNKYSLNYNNLQILFKCLDMSYKRTVAFDARPGLKFLVQKVSNLENAANLYKHTTASWIIKVLAVTELACVFKGNLNNYNLKRKITNKIDLKLTWEILCDLYINSIEIDCIAANLADNEKSSSLSDEAANASDDIDSSDNESENIVYPKFTEPKIITNVQNQPEELKPFKFSDFRKEAVNLNKENEENNYITDAENNACNHNQDAYRNKYDNGVSDNSHKDSKNRDLNDNRDTIKNNKLKKLKSIAKLKNTVTIVKNNATLGDAVLPAPPIPPEIEQERMHSIIKDSDTRRVAFANTLTAFLELILTFPEEEFEMLTLILTDGLTRLSEFTTDSLLLQRIVTFANRRDTV